MLNYLFLAVIVWLAIALMRSTSKLTSYQIGMRSIKAALYDIDRNGDILGVIGEIDETIHKTLDSEKTRSDAYGKILGEKDYSLFAQANLRCRISCLKDTNSKEIKRLAENLKADAKHLTDKSPFDLLIAENIDVILNKLKIDGTLLLLEFLRPHSLKAAIEIYKDSDYYSKKSRTAQLILDISNEFYISSPELGMACLETDKPDDVQAADAFGKMKPTHQLMAIHLFNLKYRTCIISIREWERAAFILRRNDLLPLLTAYTINYVNLDKILSSEADVLERSWESIEERKHAIYLLAFKYRGISLNDSMWKELEAFFSRDELETFRSREGNCVESNRSQDLDDRIERILGKETFRNLRWYQRFECEPIDAYSRS